MISRSQEACHGWDPFGILKEKWIALSVWWFYLSSTFLSSCFFRMTSCLKCFIFKPIFQSNFFCEGLLKSPLGFSFFSKLSNFYVVSTLEIGNRSWKIKELNIRRLLQKQLAGMAFALFQKS